MQSPSLRTSALHLAQARGLTMAKEAPEKSPEKRFPTVCGARQCQCSRIMGHLVNSKTPFFFANNNFTKKSGPRLPAKFVQQHEREMAMEVNLEAAGKVFAVKLVVGEPGNDDSVSMGLGWESFMVTAKFHEEDLLFFTLQGQSRFAVMSVRGHNRRKVADAEPEKRKLKHSEMLLSDVLKQGRTSSPAKRAAKQQKPGQTPRSPAVRSHFPPPPTLGSGEGAASRETIPGQDLKTDSEPANDPGKQHVTQLSSHDALESYMPLLESSSQSGSEDSEMEESSGEYEEDSSDYEDEAEFKNLSRGLKRRGAR